MANRWCAKKQSPCWWSPLQSGPRCFNLRESSRTRTLLALVGSEQPSTARIPHIVVYVYMMKKSKREII
uniref:Uncharacterized protein n=1 Tax=Medicago truncatula TaxID=3880 RepID=I3S0Y0_MEDTR|nr:unknown [Medicago truncatula]